MSIVSKELRKQIKNDVNELANKVGGVENILNYQILEIANKYITENDRKTCSDLWLAVNMIITNQCNHLQFAKRG